MATGLGEARSLCPSVRGTLLAGSDTGLWEIDGEGRATRLWDRPVDAVSAHLSSLNVLSEGRVRAGPWTPAGQTWAPTTELEAAGARDLLAWCDDLVLVAQESGIIAWDPSSGVVSPWASDLPVVRALALAPDCSGALAVVADGVWLASPNGSRPLATGLTDARAAAVDATGRVWVIQGDPPELGQLDGGVFRTFARYLGAPRDLHFGVGAPLLPTDAAYLADGEGTLDYVRLTGG